MGAAFRIEEKMTMEGLSRLVSEIVAEESGNVLGPEQQSMVLNRMRKRLLDLGNLTPAGYQAFLKENYHDESQVLVSTLTTHHTFFFREFSHFEFLGEYLDEMVARAKARKSQVIRIYSAGCSRGQEVYSLAMFLRKHLLPKHPGMNFEILGTDIDRESVRYGENGVFPYKEVKSIPQTYLSGNWQRGTGNIAHFARVKPILKNHCQFKTLNLFEVEKALAGQKFDMIFCRNVFIYFKPADVVKISQSFEKLLHEGGVLVTGLSESLKQSGLSIKPLATSVYQFVDANEPVVEEKKVVQSKKPSERGPLRVLCVDDSPSVLKLLTKIFQSDPDFELVGTAMNGLEASTFLKSHKVDVMTLDIHMPEQDGVEYLKKNFNSSHPKVVVVSSASREDTRYAQKTIEHGASDFVEKPALNNLKDRAEEIKMKLKMSLLSGASSLPEVDQEFKVNYTIAFSERKARVLCLSYSQLGQGVDVIKTFEGDQPPCFLVFEGNDNFLEMIQSELKKKVKGVVRLFEDSNEFKPGEIIICDSSKNFEALLEAKKKAIVSVGVIGGCSPRLADKILEFDRLQLLVDRPELNQTLKEVASDVFPHTSFEHVGTEYLAKNHE